MNTILEGLQIIARHEPDFDMSAEHDQIWAGSEGLRLTKEEKARMKELGWFRDNGSWSAFT